MLLWFSSAKRFDFADRNGLPYEPAVRESELSFAIAALRPVPLNFEATPTWCEADCAPRFPEGASCDPPEQPASNPTSAVAASARYALVMGMRYSLARFESRVVMKPMSLRVKVRRLLGVTSGWGSPSRGTATWDRQHECSPFPNLQFVTSATKALLSSRRIFGGATFS